MAQTRRDFLKTLILSAGTGVAGWPQTGAPRVARTVDDTESSRVFPQSVASGDPKPQSVVLWTRLQDERLAQVDLPLGLQMARTPSFDQGDLILDAQVLARAGYDGCVRIKVTGLQPGSVYYYCFIAPATPEGDRITSRIGRTKTAPAPDDPTPVRFALASCQDFIGRYYNAYLPILEADHLDLDFVLHVGDFIYETIPWPAPQDPDATRNLVFDDLAGAIQLQDPNGVTTALAARSLSNYRQLHRTYRTDPILQAVLERFPLVQMWDDHEFANDCWRDHANDFNGLGTSPDGLSSGRGDGRENILEQDTERRHNAEQAFLEYLPIDDEDLTEPGAAVFDPGQIDLRDGLASSGSNRYPATRLYRSLRFGANCNLLLTDYRTYRPDHAIAEDAFPARVLCTQDELLSLYQRRLGAEAGQARFLAEQRRFRRSPLGPVVDLASGLPSGLREYVHWEDLSADQRIALRARIGADYVAAGFAATAAALKAEQVLHGALDIEYLNQRLRAHRRETSADAVALIRLNVEKGAGETPNPYGLSVFNLNKISLLSDIGARFAVNPAWFERWRACVAEQAGGVPSDEDMLGSDTQGSGQEEWLAATLRASVRGWCIVASSVSNTPILLDLANPETLGPDGRLPDSAPGEANARVERLRRLLVDLAARAGIGTRAYVSLDQWDGAPNKRHQLHQRLSEHGRVVLVSGDIHSSWITDLGTRDGPLFELTETAIASDTFSGTLLTASGAAETGSAARGVTALARLIASLRVLIDRGMVEMGGSDWTEPADRLDALDAVSDQPLEAVGTRLLEALARDLIAVLDPYLIAHDYRSDWLIDARGEPKIDARVVGLDTGSNGIVVIAVDAETVRATYHLIDPAQVRTPIEGPSARRRFIREAVRRRRFEIQAGSIREV